MRESRFSIHDMSRCEASRKGEISRLNMPFELGIDFGYRSSGNLQFATKSFLVLDEKPYRLQKALSDINGWDPSAHEGNAEKAMKLVGKWLNHEAGANLPGGERLFGESLVYEEWKYGQPDQARGDIDGFSPSETIVAMKLWNELGRPTDPNVRQAPHVPDL